MAKNVRGISDVRQDGDDGPEADPYRTFAGGGSSGLAIDHPSARSEGLLARLRGAVSRQQRSDVALRVVLYRNGFTINEGPFRPLSNPANQEMIRKIKAGEAPEELRSEVPDGTDQIAVELRDKSDIDFTDVPATPSTPSLFTGQGQSLGASSRPAEAVNLSAYQNPVDLNRGTTTLAFRFHDGTRVTAKFNVDQRVEDVYTFVNRVAPVHAGYTLLFGFPPKPLTAPTSSSLQDAKLLNETLTQKV